MAIIRTGLLPLLLLHFLAVTLAVLFPYGNFRFFLAVPAILFSPGYLLLLALLPRREQLGWIARLALSVVLSMVVVFLLTFPMNYLPLGMTIRGLMVSLSLYQVAVVFAAWKRLTALRAEEVPAVSLPRVPWATLPSPHGYLSLFLVVAALGAFGSFAYALAFPPQGEAFTEFYLLDESGKADLTLRTVTAGRQWSVTVGVVNQEGPDATYRVRVESDEGRLAEVGPVELQSGEVWEAPVNLALRNPGDDRKVDFLLYRDGQEDVCRSLGLWLNVRREEERFSELSVTHLIRHPAQRMYTGYWYAASVSVENHEGREESYRAEMWIMGTQGTQKLGEVGPFSVVAESRYDTELLFNSSRGGIGQTAIFLLFRGAESEPYTSFRLPISFH
ncbi:MAG: DUF1616 domain-containing protein [Chloroflexota bacterium]